MAASTPPTTSLTDQLTLPEALATRPGEPASPFEIEDESLAERIRDQNEPIEYPRGTQLYAIVCTLILLNIVGGLDVTIVAIAIPALTNEFHTIDDIGWYATALRLTMCSFTFLFGKAYTLFNIKPILMTSLVVVSAGLAVSTFAQSSSTFIAGRALAGLGSAGVMGGMFAVMTQTFPLSRRPFIAGMLGGVETVASVSAPLIGGVLIDGWTWRACFGICLPLNAAALGIMWFYLQMPDLPDVSLPFREKIRRLDLFGLAAFVPAITCLLVALQWGGITFGWSDGRIITLLVFFAILFAVFIALQWYHKQTATLPLHILGNRNLLAGSWFCSCANGTLAVVEYYMSIYFQGPRQKSASQAGLFALPMIIGLCVSCILAGAGTSWTGYYTPFMYITTLLAPIATGLLTTIDLDTSVLKLTSLLALLGIACGSGLMAPQVAAQTVLPAKEVAIGFAIVQFGSQIGPVLFTSASATLFIRRLGVEISKSAPGVNATSIAQMGLRDVRKDIGGERLRDVLLGYDRAVVQTLYLPVALTCLTLAGTLAMEWRSTKKKEQ